MQAIILECSWSDTCGKKVAEADGAESICQIFPLLGVRASLVPLALFPFLPLHRAVFSCPELLWLPTCLW